MDPIDEAEAAYTATSIRVLDDTEALRAHPALFIGNTGPEGLHHLVRELIDNAVDEALAGYCTTIEVEVHEDGSVSVADDGRGIPVDPHPRDGRPAAEVVLTTLHAGAKFGGPAYEVSAGVHGVGLSCVCALCERLVLDVWRDGLCWHQEYARGVPSGPMTAAGSSGRRGTRVRIWPDRLVFRETTTFDPDVLEERLRELAFLQPGLELRLAAGGSRRSFRSDGALAAMVADGASDPMHDPIVLRGADKGVEVRAALLWTASTAGAIHGFANTVRTRAGGTHVAGLGAALTRTLNAYARGEGLLGEGEHLEAEDVREGLRGAVHVLLRGPEFEGQTKARLGNTEVEGVVESVVAKGLQAWLLEHPAQAREIVGRALDSVRARAAARQARELARSSSVLDSADLLGKLADCQADDASETELLVVEGDSAGGSAKLARDRRFQAVLPLRGKVLNVEKARIDKVLGNEQIRTLVAALGCGLGAHVDLGRLRYDRVILLTDADVDGAHIRTLLLTFFYRQLAPLVAGGHLYIAKPPLYRIGRGAEERWLTDEPEGGVEALRAQGWAVQRFKGLGEMSPAQLWTTTLDPATRTLERVTLDDQAETERLFEVLMGSAVGPRRRFIEAQADEEG